MYLNNLLWCLTVLKILFGPWACIAIGSDDRRCKYQRVNKLLKIRCFDMNLKEVPSNFKTSIEIMDLSFNRLKKLKRTSFQFYGNLQFLLLYENMIQSVETGTFSHLTELQEIDLSNNALVTIPLELFQLPSLRNLYVDSNDLINFSLEQELIEKPIKAPLEYLNLADCSLQDLPQLGFLPKLWHINVSMNPLEHFNIERLADLCNLRSIDITSTKINNCHCQQINNHLRAIEVDTKFVPVCLEVLNENVCPLPYNKTIDSESFQKCKTIISQVNAHNANLIWGSTIIIIFLILMLIFYYAYKRRKKYHQHRSQTKLSQRKHVVIAPKNGIHLSAKDSSFNNQSHLLQDNLLICKSVS